MCVCWNIYLYIFTVLDIFPLSHALFCFPIFRLHYTWIDIGTPNVSFLVALDAGSDLLWIPCDCVRCAPLSASYYNSLVGRPSLLVVS